MGELDLVNRDPNKMNDYVQVSFDDILAEPEGAHSADCIWENSKKCFDCGLSCWYKLLTYCCGICYALGWGCLFAKVAFAAIWFFTPMLRLYSIILHPIKKLLSIYLSSNFLKIYNEIFLLS